MGPPQQVLIPGTFAVDTCVILAYAAALVQSRKIGNLSDKEIHFIFR